jgi:DNA-directed RNA polymerase specialized sigma24 family protein
MNELLLQLKAGDITFAQYYQEAREEWKAMSQALFKRCAHRLQGSADLEDILQEMLMSIPTSIEAYDATRTRMPLKKFVVWHAHAAANDFVGRQCGAYKHRASEPARAPTIAACLPLRAATPLGADKAEDYLETLAHTDANQEWAASVRESRAALCSTMVEHIVMDHIFMVGANLKDLAESIYNDVGLREVLELKTQNRTYGLVRRVTASFANRAAGMA